MPALPPGFYSGTSNIVLPVANKSFFPEEFREKSRLAYYASLFNSLEVNSTFYKIPMPRTVEKWAADVPEDFRFTFKLWKGITHNPGLNFDPLDITRFMDAIRPASSHAGCILVQFPASIKASLHHKMEVLLGAFCEHDLANTWNIAVEFRNRSWYRDETTDLLKRYGMGMVIHDMPASATPFQDHYSKFCYLRFHGPTGDYRGSYAPDFLSEYANHISDWLNEGQTAYVYFNNTMGSALEDLVLLNKLINSDRHVIRLQQ